MELVYVYREVRGGIVEALYMFKCPRCGLTMEERHCWEPREPSWTADAKPFAVAY
jgi:hypothetical protein